MKEHPMLFTAELIQKIISGEKTMTRRIITKRNSRMIGLDDYKFDELEDDRLCLSKNSDHLIYCLSIVPHPTHPEYGHIYPRMEVGDRIWVKETFSNDWEHNRVFYRADAVGNTVTYLLDGSSGFGGGVGEAQISKWIPSIFMPRWASRITLEITAVSPERLQDIRNEDAVKEGFHNHYEFERGAGGAAYQNCINRAEWTFAEGWDKLNTKQDCTWKSNPMVWVIRFKNIT